MRFAEQKCTELYDKQGNLLFEGDRCRSWHQDELHPEGGYWLYEVIKKYQENWYLFVENHEYLHEDDHPVLLSEHLNEIERVNGIQISSVFIPTKGN